MCFDSTLISKFRRLESNFVQRAIMLTDTICYRTSIIKPGVAACGGGAMTDEHDDSLQSLRVQCGTIHERSLTRGGVHRPPVRACVRKIPLSDIRRQPQLPAAVTFISRRRPARPRCDIEHPTGIAAS